MSKWDDRVANHPVTELFSSARCPSPGWPRTAVVNRRNTKVERDARARHLQLSALNPYLANMPEGELIRLKAELAPGYFTPAATSGNGNGNGNGHEADKDSPLSAAQFAEFVRILLTKGGSGN